MDSFLLTIHSLVTLSDPLFYRGLVPLHNACSYGHYEVAELLLKYNANVNAVDLWKFTPLHEAASKGKVEICKLLLKVCDADCVHCGTFCVCIQQKHLHTEIHTRGVVFMYFHSMVLM